jgi:hypothetical protein
MTMGGECRIFRRDEHELRDGYSDDDDEPDYNQNDPYRIALLDDDGGGEGGGGFRLSRFRVEKNVIPRVSKIDEQTISEMPVFSLPKRSRVPSGRSLEVDVDKNWDHFSFMRRRFDEQYHTSSFSTQKPSVSPVDIVQTIQQILSLYSVAFMISPFDVNQGTNLILHHILTILMDHILHYFFHCALQGHFDPNALSLQTYPSPSSVIPLQNFQKQILSLLESYVYKGPQSISTLPFSYQVVSTFVAPINSSGSSHFLIITLRNLLLSSSLTYHCTSLSLLSFLLHINGGFFNFLLMKYDIPLIVIRSIKKNDENIVAKMKEVKDKKEIFKLQNFGSNSSEIPIPYSSFSLEFCLYVIRQELSFLVLFSLSSDSPPSDSSPSASSSEGASSTSSFSSSPGISLTASYVVKNGVMSTLLGLSILRFDDPCMRWMKCKINAFTFVMNLFYFLFYFLFFYFIFYFYFFFFFDLKLYIML